MHDTDLLLLDLPLISDADAAYGFYVAMADNAGPSWPGAGLYVSKDLGVTYENLGISTQPDTFGVASTTLGSFGGGNVFDESSRVTIVLTAGSGALSSTSELAVLNGANVAALGAEVIQFKNAVATVTGPAPGSTRTYVLSGLLRGRRGTEWATGLHAAAETFVVLPTKLAISGDYNDLEREFWYKAVTNGTTLALAKSHLFTNTGVTLRGYAPVHLGGGRNAAGDVILTWERRERTHGAWLDGADVPVSSAGLHFLVNVYSDSGYGTKLYSPSIVFSAGAVLTLTLTAAQQTSLFGSPQSTLYWGVLDESTRYNGIEARGST